MLHSVFYQLSLLKLIRRILLLSVPVFALAVVLREVFSASAKRCTCDFFYFPGCFLIWVLRDHITISPVLGLRRCSVVCYGFRHGIEIITTIADGFSYCFCLHTNETLHFIKFGTKFELSYMAFTFGLSYSESKRWLKYFPRGILTCIIGCGFANLALRSVCENHFVVTAPLGKIRRQKLLKREVFRKSKIMPTK